MIADLTKNFNEIFEFCVKQNFKSKNDWHPEKKASIDVQMYGSSREHPTVLSIAVFPTGKEWLKEASVKFLVVSDKPYCKMFRKNKFCKEIKIESVTEEITKALEEPYKIEEEVEEKVEETENGE